MVVTTSNSYRANLAFSEITSAVKLIVRACMSVVRREELDDDKTGLSLAGGDQHPVRRFGISRAAPLALAIACALRSVGVA